jgi:hypothetical protein
MAVISQYGQNVTHIIKFTAVKTHFPRTNEVVRHQFWNRILPLPDHISFHAYGTFEELKACAPARPCHMRQTSGRVRAWAQKTNKRTPRARARRRKTLKKNTMTLINH